MSNDEGMTKTESRKAPCLCFLRPSPAAPHPSEGGSFRFRLPRRSLGEGGSFPSHLKSFAEIKLTADRIVDEKILGAFAFDASLEDQISAVNNRQRFAYVVIGDHDGKA